MKSHYQTVEEYFAANERRSNNIYSYISFIIIPVYPVIILLTSTGVFPPANYLRMIITGIFITAMAFTFFHVTRVRPYSQGNKYFLVFLSLPALFTISIERGTHFSISYIVIPICSCIYYDESFTIKTLVAFYISMIASLGMKSIFMLDSAVNVPKTLWFTYYATGASIEYLFVGLFCIYIVREVRKLIIRNFEHKKNIEDIQEKLILGFANIVETKEAGNEKHIKRTCEYVRLVSTKLMKKGAFYGLISEHYIDLLVRAVPFYDVGKISIPLAILNKEGKLSPEEFDIVKHHPLESAEFITRHLSDLDDSELLQVAYDMALYHHERIDGSGYPYNLEGEAIPLSARILSVIDILDALLSKRSYKEAYSLDKALDIIRNMSGKTLDNTIVDALLECKDEINLIRKGEFSHEN